MLYFSAVRPPATLAILRSLMMLDSLKEFFLVGGTALALQLGHRVSVDLDLFTRNEFFCDDIILELQDKFHYTIIRKQEKNLMMLYLSDLSFPEHSVKVDFLRYPSEIIDKVIMIDNLRILSIKDIIPMKLSAISGRGAKKDFYDIYHLLDAFSIREMMDFFSQKFPNTTHFQVLKSLLYFVDAEKDLDPISLKNVYWEDIKSTIITQVNAYLLDKPQI